MKTAFANGEKNWEESENLVASLATELGRLGHQPVARDDYLQLEDFTLLPQIVSVRPHATGAMQTSTTIQVAHPELVPEGIFEFQHSTGDDIRRSLAAGFSQWAQVDLPVFRDALRAKAESSMFMVMDPAREGSSALTRSRRVVMGPFIHYAKEPVAGDDDHPFCPCCLFTNSVDGLFDLLKGDAFYGIRLFASRDADGHVEADCRVNGTDWSSGAERLRQYVHKWPQRGFEFRKQYVAIQSMTPELQDGMRGKAGSQAGASSPGVEDG